MNISVLSGIASGWKILGSDDKPFVLFSIVPFESNGKDEPIPCIAFNVPDALHGVSGSTQFKVEVKGKIGCRRKSQDSISYLQVNCVCSSLRLI